uniref:helix-turn-helix transcriptional regulator n=1 Tax=Microbacterium sp. LWH7-1.2 TaxID=3135257 RepID=UPI0040534E2C
MPGGPSSTTFCASSRTRGVAGGDFAFQHRGEVVLERPAGIAGLVGHLAEPICVAQIAEAARISVRALRYGFAHQFGVSPSRYLRDSRLRQVHAELRDADPAVTTVVAVARRWGIGHAGRFAAEYRAKFGEYPSDTLRH